MRDTGTTLDRRNFLKTGAHAAVGAAILSAGAAHGAIPTNKRIPLQGGIPEVEFGKTGHRLPILGHGGSAMVEQFIRLYGLELAPREEYVNMVRLGYEKGIRYFDTARGYGLSEGIMGEALQDVRDNVYIATKSAPRSPDSVRRDVEKSLVELRTDYIDCVQLHMFPGRVGFKEAMKCHAELAKMRDEGILRFIGLTNHSQFDGVFQGIDTGEFDQCLIEHCYIRKGLTTRHSDTMVEWREMCLSRAHELGMGVVAMKVLGAICFGHNAKNLVPDFPAEKRAKLPAAAIRWVMSDERVQILNIGISLPSDIDKNIAILEKDLTVTSEDRLLLAQFSEKAYEAESIKSLPVV